jgi:pimeloyl-ACP methyl ester carboxylesterase
MPTLPTRDTWVETPLGLLFVRIWPGQAGEISKPPIVLFHDSLGCVELWRAFPEQLAGATGRNVIAYDRLGFGRSDSHPGRLDRNFICNEA